MADELLRYVVLRHEGVDEPHFDLMFETSPGSPLAAWRAARWPLETGIPLTPLPDHRADYLTYEGPLSDNRGRVTRVAQGTFTSLNTASDNPQFTLDSGQRLRFSRDAGGNVICESS